MYRSSISFTLSRDLLRKSLRYSCLKVGILTIDLIYQMYPRFRELMEGLKNFSVIIPVKDEAEGLSLVLDELLSLGIDPSSIVVIDGGSKDGSDRIAVEKGARLIRQDGFGKADAIRTGLKHVSTEYVGVMDGDYTYPARHFSDLLKEARKCGCDLVIGSRLYGKDNIPLINRFGNWFLTKSFNVLFGAKLKDVLSGMYVVRRPALFDFLFESKGFSIESEIAAHVVSTTGRVKEIPITYRRRVGRKKLRIVDGLRIGYDMIRLAWRYHPVFFVTFLGSLLLIPGLILGGYVAFYYFFFHIKYYVKGLIAILLTIAGFQSFLVAIMALYLKRVELRMIRRVESRERRACSE